MWKTQENRHDKKKQKQEIIRKPNVKQTTSKCNHLRDRANGLQNIMYPRQKRN